MKWYTTASMTLVAIAMCVVTAPCCSPSKDPEPVIRPQPGEELCPAVCSHIGPVTPETPDALGCEEGTPVPVSAGGTVECEPDAGVKECISCVEFCIEQHRNGIFWNTECLLTIGACEQIETVCNNGGGV